MTEQTYRILILGDFHFGESYTRAGATVLRAHGYKYSTDQLRPFIANTDKFLVNLETPLVDPEIVPSPLKGRKTYIHWADPNGTGDALQDLEVDAVGLANNHTLDYGQDGLTATFKALQDRAIPWFGAGADLEEAHKPYRIELPQWIGGGDIAFHASFQYATSHDTEYNFYATQTSPGCAPISASQIAGASLYQHKPDTFHVAFPHWGTNYSWRTSGQYHIAHRLLRKGYNLVLGHGSHAIQEVHRKQQRWVVYGIGNGVFQSGGRWRRMEELNGILPFSFWTILEVSHSKDSGRTVGLKLYPVYSNNASTGYKPYPVSREDFEQIITELSERAPNAWRFDNSSRDVGEDHLGHYLHLQLGSWPTARAPQNLTPLQESGDPGDIPLRSVSLESEDAIARLYKGHSLGPSLLAMAAERHEGTTYWLSANRAVIEVQDRRFLVDGYIVHESALGEAICKDKELTAAILRQAAVPTPETHIVASADEAVGLARRLNRAVVVKPSDGNKSRGVTVDLLDPTEIRSAFERARRAGTQVLVQEHIEADEEMRIVASPEGSVAVNKRVFPHVFGDGVSTISQLIKDKNLQRQLNPSLRNRPIPIDHVTLNYLARTGHSLSEVIGLGQMITVRNVGGLGVGGDTHQALKETAAGTKMAAAKAISAIPGLGWGGVDMIIEKNTGKPYVIEINTRAAYGAALFPTYGEPEDVASAVWNIRSKIAPKEVVDTPSTLRLNRSPKTIRKANTAPDTNSRTMRLGDLFVESLLQQGYNVRTLSRRVIEVSCKGNVQRLVTKEGFTEHDRSVVTQNMRRHGIIRQLLRLRDVRRVRGRRVSSSEQFAHALGERQGPVAITPVNSVWGGKSTTIVYPAETSMPSTQFTDHELKDTPQIIQSYLSGVHVRVCATRYEPFAVLAGEGAADIDTKCVAVAGTLAVQAVRAVPELRWAMVDIVIRPRLVAQGHTGQALVEGMSLIPVMDLDQKEVAGSLDSFFSWLVTT